MSKLPVKSLIYGVIPDDPLSEGDGSLLFFLKSEAEPLAMIWKAITTAKTWAEFQKLAPPHEYEQAMRSVFDVAHLPWPSGSEPFDPDAFGPGEDDAFPPSPNEAMLDFLPKSVLAVGRGPDTPGMGDWVAFQASQEHQVVGLLKSAGWRVERNDELARRAAGNWLPGP